MTRFVRGFGGSVSVLLLGSGCAAGGIETWFDGPGDCRSEAYQLAPAWDCSPEVLAQLEEDRAVIAGYTQAVPEEPGEELIAHGSCAAGVESTRNALKAAYDYELRSQRVSTLSTQCSPRTAYRTVGDCSSNAYGANGGSAAPGYGSGGSASFAPTPTIEDSSGATEYSTTNNQVAGVDEADFLKNDAEFVYTIATQPAYNPDPYNTYPYTDPNAASDPRGELVIADVWPPEEAREVSRIALEGSPKKLHLDGDRLLVYSSVPRPSSNDAYPGYGYGGYYYGNGECTYGYDCVPTGDGMATLVTIYDISDRSAPVPLRRIELSGSYINSRRIGDLVYTVVHDPARTIPGLVSNVTLAESPEKQLEAYEAKKAENDAKIAEAPPEKLLPEMYVTTTADPAAKSAIECGDVFEAPGAPGAGFLSVLALNMVGDETVRRATVISAPGFTYASADALYVAVPSSDWAAQSSLIHKFQLSGITTRYAASGVVEGRVLNQFSMDEFGGDLRVATTTGHAPDPNTHSALTVLEPQAGRLVTIGKIDDIAPSEDIRSARFVGDRGYVVTFKKTDPLYVFDLADRLAPRIAGELKIPGFSTYMHPLDAGHILSIGYDAEDQGDFAFFQGIQLQIFDVTDMSNPTLLHKQVIGTRGSSSEALTNHLAFTYFAPKRWLALPITICEGSQGGGSYAEQMTFSGLYMYDVGVDTGFNLLGGVSHPPTGGYEAYGGGASCSNWWTDASSQVKRSIIMDDYVLSVSDREIKLNSSADFGVDVASIALQVAPPEP